jgi:hypothetical protein
MMLQGLLSQTRYKQINELAVLQFEMPMMVFRLLLLLMAPSMKSATYYLDLASLQLSLQTAHSQRRSAQHCRMNFQHLALK